MNTTLKSGGLLTLGSLLATTGIVYLDKNIYAGLILVVLGVGCYFGRELLKKKKS